MSGAAPTHRLSALCAISGWHLLRDAELSTLGFVESAIPGRLVFAMDAKNLERAGARDGIAAILTTPALAGRVPAGIAGVATADDPRRAFVELHNHLATATGFYGAPAPSRIDPSAVIHPRAHVDQRGVTVGPRCRVDAGAALLEGAELAEDVHILAGAVIGGAGFQTEHFADAVLDMRHAGRVHIGARSQVLCNAVVARAVFDQATSIGADCRIGHNACVSHNCRVGARCLVGHGAVIAGNTVLGEGVRIGPGAVCIDRLVIGDGAIISAGAVVIRPVAAGQRVSGNFAVDHGRRMREMDADT
jgi:UDP-3-O-[3-hydroxymyristoyl] glucosamine N-acyltransferase